MSLLKNRRWPYVLLTGVVSGAVAWWAIPHLGTRTHLSGTYQGNDIGPVLPTLSLDTLVSPASAQVMLLAAAARVVYRRTNANPNANGSYLRLR